MKKSSYILMVLALVMVFSLNACKQYFDPPLVFEPDPGPNLTKDRKVLLISIDGLAGLELYNYVPQNISGLLENAKYTFEGIADANTHDAAAWTTMLSSKNSGAHGVHSDDFEEDFEEDPDDPHGHNSSGPSTGYISVYQRLLETGRPLKSLSITPWEPLDHHLFNLSDENGTVESDEAVRDKAVDRIANGEDNLTFVVVNFRDLNAAGLAGGFSMDNADYKTTLDRIDGYVGDIVAAIGERKRAANEDWLIIVTSNHGGLGNSYGGASLEERKVPMIYYNANFVGQQFQTPNLINSLVINTKTANTPTISAENSAIYDMGSSGEYTVMFKVFNRALPGGSSHAVILGRTTHAYSSPRGWHFMVQGANGQNKYRVITGNGTGTLTFTVSGASAKTNEWETLAFKVYNEDGKRWGKIYVNGVGSSATDLTGRNLTANVANFIVGSGSIASIGTFNGMVNNLVFANTALTDEDIENFACLSTIDESVPYWSDLTGYWPLNEGAGRVSANKKETALDTDFHYAESTYARNLFEAWRCGTLTDEEEKNLKMVYAIDILPQIFYWLKIETHDSWNLEGSVFLDGFEREFINK